MQRDRRGRPSMDELSKHWLKVRYGKPGRVFAAIVHRLDAPVAGVVVLARTSKAAGRLSEQFRQGTVEKVYLAVVQGRPPRSSDRVINHLVRRGRASRIVPAGTKESQEARLCYRLIDADDQKSLLSIGLETGRRHQIRLQLAAIGCPILGDRMYGADRGMPGGRIALMARRIGFTHPTLKTEMRFESPTPVDWPWPGRGHQRQRPLWTIETFLADGLQLPAPE